MAYYRDGVEAVKQLAPKQAVLRKALQQIADDGKDYRPLEDWTLRKYRMGVILEPNTGNRSPVAGERRAYQTIKERSRQSVLRLPMDGLGRGRGLIHIVSFEERRVVVEW